MREGKELIHATKEFARDNKAKSWWYILSTSAILIALFIATLSPLPFALKLACSLTLGLVMVRMFVIYHDQQHKAILAGSKVADLMMRSFGIWFIAPSSIWNSSHNYHHTHNSKLRSAHIGSYPIMTKNQYLKASGKERTHYLLMRHPLTMVFGYIFIFLIGMCVAPALRDAKRHADSIAALILHIAFNAVVFYFFGLTTLLLAVTLPYFVACGAGSYLFYAQHNFPDATFCDNEGWTFVGAAMESSSYLDTNKLFHWFTANIGYHHIHHLNARIPFYRLPEAMQNVPELQKAKKTSLSLSEIFRCLRLKVWDADSNKLLTLHELKSEEQQHDQAA